MIKIELTLAESVALNECLTDSLLTLDGLNLDLEYIAPIEQIKINLIRGMISDYVVKNYYDDSLGKVHRIGHTYNCGPTYHDCKGNPTVDLQEDVDIEVMIDDDDWLTCLTIWAYEKLLIEHDDIIQWDEKKGWVFVAIDFTDEQIPDLIKQIIAEIKADVNGTESND
jgi:hypothetical protein